MIELNWYKSLNQLSKKEAWYVRPVTKQMLTIHEMAQHMEQHNTPFSAGTIEGILTDFVKCVHEQLLNGNSVKIEDLAIFRVSLQSYPFKEIGGIDTTTGQFTAQARVGSSVRTLKLLATATGNFMRAQLNKDVRFEWCTEAKANMEARRNEVLEGIASGKEAGGAVEPAPATSAGTQGGGDKTEGETPHGA